MIAALFGGTAAYLLVGWLCLHLGTLASIATYDEHMGTALTTITFMIAHLALVLWLSQIGNTIRLFASLFGKGHRAIHERSFATATV
jgi:hypothetical protein